MVDEEVTWAEGPHECRLDWNEGILGTLFFINPKDGSEDHITVITGASYSTANCHVWHVELQGEKVIVSPSIHFIGHFHSPNPVEFKLVESF